MRHRDSAVVLLAILALAGNVWAVPDDLISVPNTFTNNTTADASEVNANFNEASNSYNVHTHTDIASTTSNTFTVGDNASGNKAYAVNNQFTTAPSIRYRDVNESWQFSNDASTFFNVVGTTSPSIQFAAGQVLIGQGTSLSPIPATLTAGDNITITNSPGNIRITGTSTGDITAVGPGCATGACFTDTVTTTGTNVIVWEGTTSDANEYTVAVPAADPSADITLTLPTASLTMGDFSTRVNNSAAISISNNTVTTLTFNSERWDTDTMHSTAANTDRITFTTAGKYLVGCHVEWADNATGARQTLLLLNGATDIGRQAHVAFSSGGLTNFQEEVTHYNYAANDYVICQVWQNSGAALNVNATGNRSPEFWAVKLP